MSMEGGAPQRKRYGGFEAGVKPEEEQQYYKTHWERLAALRNKEARAGVQTSSKKDAPAFVTADDVMRQAADRDNKLYDKWASQEYQESDEKLRDFFNDIKAVRDNPSDKPENFKFVALGMGTGLSSAYETGQDMMLEDFGYSKLIDVAIGSSGASGPKLFQAAGQSREGASLFMNECMSPEFFHRAGGIVPVLDTRVISKEMRSGPKAVDLDALRKSHTQAWAMVTNKKTGNAELKNMSEAPDPIVLCEASSAIPGMKIPSVKIEGNEYVDGAFSDLPLEKIIEDFKPSHLLIQPNRAFEFLAKFKNELSEDIIEKGVSIFASLSPHAYSLEQLYKMKKRVGMALEKIGKERNVKIAILWPPDEELDVFTQDPDMIRIGIMESYRKAVSDLGEKQPERIRFFPGDNLEKIESAPPLAQAA